MSDLCVACGKPIVLVNIDKMRGVVGLTQGWIHRSRRPKRNHRAIPQEMVEKWVADG